MARDRLPRPVSLKIKGLSFDSASILGALSLYVHAGETLAILGPSGIGKTSLLRCIAGLETRFEGSRNVTQSLAYVFQEPTLLPWRTALENITLVARCDEHLAKERLAEAGLADKADLFPGQLSLGQQRRLSLARAFAVKPQLLLMDEPFVSLDRSTSDEMQSHFAKLRDLYEITTIFVTHAQSEAQRLATRTVTLNGKPATLADEKILA